jgi:hypothetical protein
MLGVSLHFGEITLHFQNLQGGDRFDLDCVRHHAVHLVLKVSDAVTKASDLRAFAG